MTKVAKAYVTDDNPIVEIIGKESSLFVMWVIGTRCNFACSYCPDVWHDKHSPHKTLDELQQAWRKLMKSLEKVEKQITISVLGGEPTMNPDLILFLKWVKEEFNPLNAIINVYSNGTATVEYYQTLIEHANIVFSTHSEFMNEAKFFSTVSKAQQHASKNNLPYWTYVIIMNEEWNQTRIKHYIKYLAKQKIPCGLSPVEPVYRPNTNWPEQDIKPSLGPKKSNKVNFYERITS
jgi:sulfatase maturation enzyme AslB (radical SAM superfamily)